MHSRASRRIYSDAILSVNHCLTDLLDLLSRRRPNVHFILSSTGIQVHMH